MKNINDWKPTKYEWKSKRLRGSRNPAHLTVSSRLVTDITASFYQEYIPKYANGKLADLGCGNVPFYHVYKNHVTENICADWPNTSHKNQYLDIECDLNQILPFPSSEFDTIIISEVLEHISNPELLWNEMSRILKPKGKILLSVPFFYKIHEAPFDFYRYTEFALKKFAEKNNLTVLELKSFGGLPEILADIIAKNAAKLPLIGNFLCRMIQSSCWSFVHTSIGRKISNNSGVAYPLGYFMVVEKK
jgi:SAM-dependent methyltransferase